MWRLVITEGRTLADGSATFSKQPTQEWAITFEEAADELSGGGSSTVGALVETWFRKDGYENVNLQTGELRDNQEFDWKIDAKDYYGQQPVSVAPRYASY